MAKIKMTTPLVEIDGDEMTRILWKWVKDIIILPYVDLKTEYYDLSIQNRDLTDDKVTTEAANACLKYGVGVKCATITPNTQRQEEFNLKRLYPSPNATIRAIMDGTVFRSPVLVKGVSPLVPTWTAPIVIARHAYGDIYKAVEIRTKGGKAVLSCGDEEKVVFDFGDKDGIILGQHNTDKSITSFARSCFSYAVSTKQDLWFSTKDTISKVYDHRFKDIFQEIYENEYKSKFEELGIEYFYTLIDDAVARVMRSKGGYIWALKNYDGDVMSDMVATAFGSLAMMTSVLVSPTGAFEYEAAHGTVTRHFRKYQNGEETSTNSVATLFAWTGALRKRGELDNNSELVAFADKVEKATIDTIENGEMTKDLAA
ncbi:MAG: NADP-dependent isocitrate dehydrogenase, partial [Clostridia bacterium]|nr:NADP-dependent isocitrate dehydrogenase [Clostridia bacterium]